MSIKASCGDVPCCFIHYARLFKPVISLKAFNRVFCCLIIYAGDFYIFKIVVYDGKRGEIEMEMTLAQLKEYVESMPEETMVVVDMSVYLEDYEDGE